MAELFCERIKTIRRYVHPPISERMFTLWPEVKVIFGEYDIDIPRASVLAQRMYDLQISSGLWLVYGKDAKSFDFRGVKHEITEDGTPIHRVVYTTDNMEISLETFCNSVQKATLFGEVQIRNITDVPLKEVLFFLMRTMQEDALITGYSDGYASYSTDLEKWTNYKSTWYPWEDGYTDGQSQVTFSIPTQWTFKPGGTKIDICLNPGEAMSFTFKMDRGEVISYDYEAEKAKTVAFWQQELMAINKLPKALANDPEKGKAVRHMVVQLLQMFACTKRERLIIPRQGGMQRVIWPTEALSVIEGLCAVGEFGKYIEPVFDTYFGAMQKPSGEIGAFGIYWGSITAAVLYSFAVYCKTANNWAFFGKYRDRAYAAFQYIKTLRNSVKDSDEIAGGLFPILRGTDWKQQFQCWTSTDVFNLFGLDALADTFAAYKDPVAEEIRREHTAYLADMRRHFQKYYDQQAGKNTLRIPLKPMGDDRELVEDFYPLLYQGRAVFCGLVDNKRDVLRVYNQMLQTGVTVEGLGLYGHMPYRNGNNGIWYLSFPDYYWFEIWMKYGYREKAKEIIDAQLRYAMTEEYYFAERMDVADPYFVPWSPNASATGRMLIMLTKYYSVCANG